MNTQMTRTHAHHYEEDPLQQQGLGSHSGGHQEDEHEKKSVIKKVKAKAKKIKDTIGHLKKHGHEHDHDHDHDHDQDLDEEDDYDEELEEDPEVHGAPMYDSAAAAGIGNFGQPRIDLTQSPTAGLRSIAKDEKVDLGQPQIKLGQSSQLEEDPHAPKDHGPGAFSSPGNYQTKVTDPTGAGGKEANVEPMIRSFGKMGVTDGSEPEHKSFTGTGSHDQFSPDSPSIGTKTIPENSQPGTQTFDATKPEHQHPEDMNVDQEPRNRSSSYTEKISSATSAIAGKAISAKNVVASKLGYGGHNDNVAASGMKKGGEGEHAEHTKSSTAAVGEYGRQIASTVTEKLAPVYEKVAGAGTAVVSKVQGTVSGTSTDTGEGTGTGTGPETGTGMSTAKEQDKGMSIKDYLQEKFSPGDEDKALSQVISDALHKRKEDYPEHIAKSMDKVTESPEVARQWGTDDYEHKEADSGNGSGSGSQAGPNKGMVDRVKGVVSSWFGKGVGDQVRPTESSRSPDSLSVDEQENVSGAPAAGSGVGHESAGTAH